VTRFKSILLACCALSFFANVDTRAEDMPGVDAISRMGEFVGDWNFRGVTSKGIDGVAGGVPFTATQTVQWVVPMEVLSVDWEMYTDDGVRFSSGRSQIRWDDIAEAVMNTYAGQDGGRSFKGVTTLIASNRGNFDWRGHESSGAGESLNYETTYRIVGGDRWQVDFIPTCADNTVIETMRFEWERNNEFKMALGPFTELVGTWSGLHQDAEGRTVISSIGVEWGPGDHALLVAVREDVDGESILAGVDMIYRNEDAKAIRTRFIGSRGLVAEGSFKIDLNQSSEMVVAEGDWSGVNAMGQRIEMRRRIEIIGNQMVQKMMFYSVDGRESDSKSLEAMERIFQRTS
jgi:hypothetical protein